MYESFGIDNGAIILSKQGANQLFCPVGRENQKQSAWNVAERLDFFSIYGDYLHAGVPFVRE